MYIIDLMAIPRNLLTLVYLAVIIPVYTGEPPSTAPITEY
jgi:hypothetical protein